MLDLQQNILKRCDKLVLMGKAATPTLVGNGISVDKPNLVLGFGLITPKKSNGSAAPLDNFDITLGLPIEALAMLTTALAASVAISESLGVESKVYVIIADRVAIQDFGLPQELITKAANKNVKAIQNFLENTNMKNRVEIVPESEIELNLTAEDQNKLADMPSYERAQNGLIMHFNRNKGVGCKVGWIADAKNLELVKNCDSKSYKSRDEGYFDILLKPLLPAPMSFLYTFAGANIISSSHLVCVPYNAKPGQERLCVNTSKSLSHSAKRKLPQVLTTLLSATSSTLVGLGVQIPEMPQIEGVRRTAAQLSCLTKIDKHFSENALKRVELALIQ